MKLSNQAMGAIMMALQKSLMEQEDIVPVLGEFIFEIDSREMLVVANPPSFHVDPTDESTDLPEESKATTGSD